MNKKINLRWGLAAGAIVAIIGGVVVFGAIVFWSSSDNSSAPEAMEKKVMIDEGGVMKEEEKAMLAGGEEGVMVAYGGKVLAGTSAKLLDFNKADYDKALASDNLVVLYFYANWCPSCKVEFPKMQSVFDEIKSDKVVAFRVNYKDSETDKDEEALAKEFGVAYQHTKVFLKGGERVLKAPDSWEKERYLSEINKFAAVN